MFFGYWIYSFKKRGYNQPNLASKYYGSKASPKKVPLNQDPSGLLPKQSQFERSILDC